MEQGQLWDAGPVRIGRGKSPKPLPRCAEEGCSNPRRRAQSAKFCDEHTRSRKGRTSETRRCLRPACGQTFEARLPKGDEIPVTLAWREFCPDCRDETPVSFTQLLTQRVPAELVRQWLIAGEDLRCDLCVKRFTRKNRPTIDHDRRCCPRKSAGCCIRGVVHMGCNTVLASFERLDREGVSPEDVAAYLRRAQRPPLELVAESRGLPGVST